MQDGDIPDEPHRPAHPDERLDRLGVVQDRAGEKLKGAPDSQDTSARQWLRAHRAANDDGSPDGS